MVSFLCIQDLRGNPERALLLNWYVVCISGFPFICHSRFGHSGMDPAGNELGLGAWGLGLLRRHSLPQGNNFQHLLLLSSSSWDNLALLSVSYNPNLLPSSKGTECAKGKPLNKQIHPPPLLPLTAYTLFSIRKSLPTHSPSSSPVCLVNFHHSLPTLKAFLP